MVSVSAKNESRVTVVKNVLTDNPFPDNVCLSLVQ